MNGVWREWGDGGIIQEIRDYKIPKHERYPEGGCITVRYNAMFEAFSPSLGPWFHIHN